MFIIHNLKLNDKSWNKMIIILNFILVRSTVYITISFILMGLARLCHTQKKIKTKSTSYRKLGEAEKSKQRQAQTEIVQPGNNDPLLNSQNESENTFKSCQFELVLDRINISLVLSEIWQQYRTTLSVIKPPILSFLWSTKKQHLQKNYISNEFEFWIYTNSNWYL